MPCLYCQKESTQFSRNVPVQDERVTHQFPIDDIVGNPLNRFKEIYECKDCHSLWWIKTKGTGDPRSTYPEFYEQTAERIDDQRSELIRNPSVSRLVAAKETSFPYSFFEEILEILSKTETEKLKVLYFNRDPSLPSAVKRWLRQWFQKEFPLEFQGIQNKGLPNSANLLIQLEENESILVSEFIGKDQFVFISYRNEKYFLQSFDLSKKKILWKEKIQKPFLEGIDIPILFYQSGYLCIYQGFQKGSEFYSKLNKPDTLCIFDLSGKLIVSVKLAFQCYEILSTEERDLSENRVVHNFSFTILSETLYLPHQSKIQTYDLISGKLMSSISLPKFEIFSGKAFETESGNLLFHTLKGIYGVSPSGEEVFQYFSPYYPVYIDSQFQLYFYYAIVESANTGKKKFFQQTHSSGISLVRELASPPVEFPGGIYLPFSLDGSLLLDSQLKTLKELPFSTTDTLGPHSFGTAKSPVLVTEDRITITADYSAIHMIDFLGNVVFEKPIHSEIIRLFTFDGKHIVLILSLFDDYSEAEQIELILLSPNGMVIKQKMFPGPKGLSVSFDGICIFAKNNQIYSIDLFETEESK
ncbi:hypothetical protein [Leptospira harrisiae]|uniref:ERV/ALR sulfhydryl oxidase domain-containing protein n=1 Tax=Leptospira harrisiae TaxID=2023189 RepID=A0A2N0AJ84_9LEPT|nr:hypothetical protein [Leptospira harrisiae]PJZ84362.1 hypothetical protein CH364_10040 [Leptospira harrisiae]PKA07105.1 hypothetical protein CH366_11740 [Leptospira harrisiae]